MTDEERDIITRFIQRISGAPQGGGSFGSVPAPAPSLPPVDPEADGLIGDLFSHYPEAPYRMTQTAFAQEAALNAAQNRIKQLEWQLQQARQAAQPASGGFFSGLFGGGNRQASAPPPGQQGGPWGQPQQQGYPPQQGYPQQQGYAPQQGYPPQQGYAPPPQMLQRGGSGFLGSALTTAAGVAGGLVAGNALMDLFSGHQGGGFGGAGFGGAGVGGAMPGSETVINNYYGNDPSQDASMPTPPPDPGQDPWGNQQGGLDQASQDPGSDQGWQDASLDPGTGNDDGGFDPGGGFDDTQDV